MNKTLFKLSFLPLLFVSFQLMKFDSFAEDPVVLETDTSMEAAKSPSESEPNPTSEEASAAQTDAANSEKNKEELVLEEPVVPVRTAPAKSLRRDRADAFVAGPDWEFDGFVAGGQDSNVRSMFYLNDLVYINIGSVQGVTTGGKIGIYKRGDRVKDPQTGKFIGYEVRRAAIARATDRVEEETAAVRILNTYEAVEIGDLVRRE